MGSLDKWVLVSIRWLRWWYLDVAKRQKRQVGLYHNVLYTTMLNLLFFYNFTLITLSGNYRTQSDDIRLRFLSLTEIGIRASLKEDVLTRWDNYWLIFIRSTGTKICRNSHKNLKAFMRFIYMPFSCVKAFMRILIKINGIQFA